MVGGLSQLDGCASQDPGARIPACQSLMLYISGVMLSQQKMYWGDGGSPLISKKEGKEKGFGAACQGVRVICIVCNEAIS